MAATGKKKTKFTRRKDVSKANSFLQNRLNCWSYWCIRKSWNFSRCTCTEARGWHMFSVVVYLKKKKGTNL